MAVHSVLVAMPLARHGSGTRNQDDRGASIKAMLVASNETATGMDAMVLPAPLEPISDYTLPPALPAAIAVPPATAAAPARESGGLQGGVLVEAQPLKDPFRLGGELMGREMTDFPLELDSSVEMRQTIVARYPPAALAAGRGGSVVAWVLVDASGICTLFPRESTQRRFAFRSRSSSCSAQPSPPIRCRTPRVPQ